MQSTRRLSQRLTVAAAVALLGVATAAADDEPGKFIEGLRARKMHDAVEEYLLELRDKPDLSPQWRQRIPLELGRTHVDKAQQLAEGPARLPELTKAQTALEEFVKRSPEHASAGDARRLLGSVLLQRGAALLKASQDPQRAEEATALREEAQAAYQQALVAFEKLIEIHQARLAAFPKFVDRTDQQQYEARGRAQTDLIVAQMFRGGALYESARSYAADGGPRRRKLQQAAEAYHEIYEKHRRLVAGLYAHMYEARCYQALGEERRAQGIYAELLALPDQPDVFARIKQRVKRLQEGGPDAAPAPESK